MPRTNRVQLQEKKAKALQMALGGASYETIARECGWANKSTAYRHVQNAMRDWSPIDYSDAQTMRAQEMARLDRLMTTHWVNALRGDVRASEICLRIIQQRCRIMGLEAPTKIDATVKSGIDAEIEELLRQLPAPTKG